MNSIPTSAWQVGSGPVALHTAGPDDLTSGKHPAPGLAQLGVVKSIKWETAVGWRRGESQSGAVVGFIGMPCVW